MRPDISDSLISGQPLYLLYSKSCPSFAFARAVQETGSVRLHVTGRPPTTRDALPSVAAPSFFLQPTRGSVAAAAAAPAPQRKSRRWRFTTILSTISLTTPRAGARPEQWSFKVRLNSLH